MALDHIINSSIPLDRLGAGRADLRLFSPFLISFAFSRSILAVRIVRRRALSKTH
jgi:hypothetical protein